MRGLLGAAVVALVLATSAPAVAAPHVPADAEADCTGKGGVFVVVDQQNGTLKTGCATKPKNGEDALAQIGVKITHGSSGFITAMDGYPTEDKSSQNIYWNYFHKSPGGAWEYSEEGAATYVPKAGSVEGWAYGSTGVEPLKQGASTSQTPASPTPAGTAPASPAPTQAPATGTPVGLLVTLALVAVALVAGFWFARARREAPRR